MKTSLPKRTVPADDYQPAADYLLVKPELADEISEGGIVIPEQARSMLNEGEILKVGPDVAKHFQPGMFVVFSPATEYRLELEKGIIVLAVAQNNIMLYRHPQKSLFPAKAKSAPLDPFVDGN